MRFEVAAEVKQLDPSRKMRHDEFVFGFLKKLGLSGEAENPPSKSDGLRGIPALRRMKHYAADSGYAYEYYFEGYRNRPQTREFVFSVSGDRKNWNLISILLPDAAIEPWQKRTGRMLADNERYAIAKLSLFAVFDESESPLRLPCSHDVWGTQVEEMIARLRLD